MISKPSIRLPHCQSSRKGYCTYSDNPWTQRNATHLLSSIESIRLAQNGALNPSRSIWSLRHRGWFTSISKSKSRSMRRAASMIFFSLLSNRQRRLKAPLERYKSLRKSLKDEWNECQHRIATVTTIIAFISHQNHAKFNSITERPVISVGKEASEEKRALCEWSNANDLNINLSSFNGNHLLQP